MGMPPKKELKGVLAKLLRISGIEPTENRVFKIRLAIVGLGILFVLYTYITYDSAGKKYGNYDDFKSQLPQ